MKNSKEIVVDVRTEEEWNEDGHGASAVNIPFNRLAREYDKLKGYDQVILVCRSGARAGAAKAMLEKAGFKNVVNRGPWQNAK
jgi:phage shock protein E